jgi:Zn-dependent oligopeptidase
MLENWVWDPQILKLLSSNVNTGDPLPDDTIAKMRAARYVDNAYYTTQQIVYATVDMKYHSSGPHVDTTALWRAVADKEVPTGLAPGTHPQAGFGHLMGGYDAGYYGYLWSKVYAQDMFTAFEAGGLESPIVGARYRHDILEPARELEPDAEVKAFLGRPMDPTAFYNEFNEEGTTAKR